MPLPNVVRKGTARSRVSVICEHDTIPSESCVTWYYAVSMYLCAQVFQAIVTFDALDSIELYPKTKSHELLVDHRFYTDYFKGQAASDAELNDTFGTTDYKEIAKHFFMKNADGSAFQRSCLHDDFRKFYSGHGGLDDETNQETTKQVNDSFSVSCICFIFLAPSFEYDPLFNRSLLQSIREMMVSFCIGIGAGALPLRH